MKTLFIILILLPAIFSGCGLLTSDPDWIVGKLHSREVEIPPEASLGEPIVFIVKSSFSNPCWKFNGFVITQSGFDVIVTPYKKIPNKSQICSAVMVDVSEGGRFRPVIPGEYRFHFWRADTLSLDYVVTVR